MMTNQTKIVFHLTEWFIKPLWVRKARVDENVSLSQFTFLFFSFKKFRIINPNKK